MPRGKTTDSERSRQENYGRTRPRDTVASMPAGSFKNRFSDTLRTVFDNQGRITAPMYDNAWEPDNDKEHFSPLDNYIPRPYNVERPLWEARYDLGLGHTPSGNYLQYDRDGSSEIYDPEDHRNFKRQRRTSNTNGSYPTDYSIQYKKKFGSQRSK